MSRAQYLVFLMLRSAAEWERWFSQHCFDADRKPRHSEVEVASSLDPVSKRLPSWTQGLDSGDLALTYNT